MWAVLVVVGPPRLDLDLRILQRGEPSPVQTLLPEPVVHGGRGGIGVAHQAPTYLSSPVKGYRANSPRRHSEEAFNLVSRHTLSSLYASIRILMLDKGLPKRTLVLCRECISGKYPPESRAAAYQWQDICSLLVRIPQVLSFTS